MRRPGTPRPLLPGVTSDVPSAALPPPPRIPFMNIHEGVGWGRGNTLRKNFRSYIFLESRALADHRLGKRARARLRLFVCFPIPH